MTHLAGSRLQLAQQDAVQQVIDRWLASLSSANTRAAYRLDLAAFVRWCDAHGTSALSPSADVVERFRTDPSLPSGTAAVARRRAAVNAFFRHLDQPAAAPTSPAASGTPAVPVATTGAGDDERRAAAAGGGSPTARLDTAQRRTLLRSMPRHSTATQVLVAMLLLDGLKLDEVLRLDAGSVTGRLPELQVQLDRTPPSRHELHTTTAAVVAAHLDGRRRGPLLVTASRREQAGARLSRHGADYLLRQAGARAGLAAPLTSNVLRRTHAAHAHAIGQSVDAIARRMGHDDVRTTRRYLDPTPTPGGVGSRRRPTAQEV